MKFIGLLSAVALGVAGAQAPAGRVDVSARAVAAAATKYVDVYQKDFAFLVADESNQQTAITTDPGHTEHRSFKSEFFLTYLPADRRWMAIRDVMEVDGAAVLSTAKVRDVLKNADDRRVFETLKAANSVHNLGKIFRDFNEPTMPLALLAPDRIRNLRLERASIDRLPDATLVTVRYEEGAQAPLIRFDGKDSRSRLEPAPSKGEFVVDAADGSVRRTLMTLAPRDLLVQLETVYEREPRLKLWVPSVFRERYERRSTREVITVESRYTNYRRFEGSGRIKK